MILLSNKSVCFRTDADIRIKGCLFRSQVYDGTKSRLYENMEDGGNGAKSMMEQNQDFMKIRKMAEMAERRI